VLFRREKGKNLKGNSQGIFGNDLGIQKDMVGGGSQGKNAGPHVGAVTGRGREGKKVEQRDRATSQRDLKVGCSNAPGMEDAMLRRRGGK